MRSISREIVDGGILQRCSRARHLQKSVRLSGQVWDPKRQIIWLVAGISFGTFIVYRDAHDETGRFDASVFAFWEIILLAIILTLFYLYSRKKN